VIQIAIGHSLHAFAGHICATIGSCNELSIIDPYLAYASGIGMQLSEARQGQSFRMGADVKVEIAGILSRLRCTIDFPDKIAGIIELVSICFLLFLNPIIVVNMIMAERKSMWFYNKIRT